METEQSQQHPGQDIFKITAEQQEQLNRVEMGPEAEALMHSFGAVVMEGNVALVVETAEDGSEIPSHYIDIGSNNLGTRLNPNRSERAKQLPTPDEALQILNAQDAAEADSAQTEQEQAAAAERIIEESEIAATLTKYDQLLEGLEIGRETELTAINAAAQHVDQLLTALQEAAESGQWADNQLSNYPALLLRITEISDFLEQTARDTRTSSEETVEATRHFSNEFTESSETAASQLTALESESARPVAYALGEAVSAVQLAQTKSTDLSDEKLHSLGLVAGQLSDLSYSPNMSVGDAHSLLLNSQTMLGELVAASAQDAKLYDEATEAIEAVQRILER